MFLENQEKSLKRADFGKKRALLPLSLLVFKEISIKSWTQAKCTDTSKHEGQENTDFTKIVQKSHWTAIPTSFNKKINKKKKGCREGKEPGFLS